MKHKFHPFLAAIAVAIAALFMGPDGARAQEAPKSRITVSVAVEIENDYSYESGDRDEERNNLFAKIQPEWTVRFTDELSLLAHGVLNQVADAGPREDRYFEDQGFYFEDLFLTYETGTYAVRAGKLNPGFGIAWDAAPGLYGSEFAEDYEMTERIGITAGVTFGAGDGGRHTLAAGTFFLDTTVLRHTLGRSRGTLGHSDGGVSNTEDFSSFNLVLDGGGFAAAPKFSYHLGLIRQANGVDGTTDETGIVIGVSHEFDLGAAVTLAPLVEFARFGDSGGSDGTDVDYRTFSLQGKREAWNLALSYTERDTAQTGSADIDDYLVQVSAGYQFASGWAADVGWKQTRTAGVHTDTVGILLAREF